MAVLGLFRRKKTVVKADRKRSEPKVAPEIVESAANALAEAMERYPMSYQPALEWRRYTVTAGMAHFQEGVISLSSIVLKDPEHVRETLLHEYAHLLAFERHGNKGAGHGRHWKKAMRDLGLEPKVHHHYEVVRNESRQVVVYQCKKCGEQFSRKRQIPRSKRYFHRHCGGQIVFVEVQRATTRQETA